MDTQLHYPKAIVFDLWYTLICPEHHRPPGVRSINAIPAVLNLDPKAFVEHWEAHLPPRCPSDPRPLREYIADYVSRLGRTLSDAEYAAFDNVWSAHDLALGSPRPVLSALSRLAAVGVRLALLSNAHEREIRGWRSSPFSSFFDVASLFMPYWIHKTPDERVSPCTSKTLSVRPEDALYVGDGASNELQGARDVGFGTVVFMRGLLKELQVRGLGTAILTEQAHFVVDSVEELVNVIPGLDRNSRRSRLTNGCSPTR